MYFCLSNLVIQGSFIWLEFIWHLAWCGVSSMSPQCKWSLPFGIRLSHDQSYRFRWWSFHWARWPLHHHADTFWQVKRMYRLVVAKSQRFKPILLISQFTIRLKKIYHFTNKANFGPTQSTLLCTYSLALSCWHQRSSINTKIIRAQSLPKSAPRKVFARSGFMVSECIDLNIV